MTVKRKDFFGYRSSAKEIPVFGLPSSSFTIMLSGFSLGLGIDTFIDLIYMWSMVGGNPMLNA